MGMTIEQCCDALFKSMETLAILQIGLLGFYGLIVLAKLGRIEEKLNKMMREKDDGKRM